MTRRVWRFLLTEDASRQAEEIARWWIANRPAARDLFAAELQRSLERLIDFPLSGTSYLHPDLPGLRRVLLRTTQYHLYYSLNEVRRVVTVHGLWHAARGSLPELG